MLNPTPLSLALVEAANKLADEDLIQSIRSIIDARFSGHHVRSISWAADDADALLSNMAADLPNDLPTYADIMADIDRHKRVMGYLDRRA